MKRKIIYTLLMSILSSLNIIAQESQKNIYLNLDIQNLDYRGNHSGIQVEYHKKKLVLGAGIKYMHARAYLPVHYEIIKLSHRFYPKNVSDRLTYNIQLGYLLNSERTIKYGVTQLFYSLSYQKSFYRNDFWRNTYYSNQPNTYIHEYTELRYPNVITIDNTIGFSHKATLYKNLMGNFTAGAGVIYFNGINYNDLTRNALRLSYQVGIGLSYKLSMK